MKPAARRRARECAVQALYSWQLSQNDIADVEYQFLAEQDVKDVDVLYFRELLARHRTRPLWAWLKLLWQRIDEDNMTTLAGNLAYVSLLSLVPLVRCRHVVLTANQTSRSIRYQSGPENQSPMI